MLALCLVYYAGIFDAGLISNHNHWWAEVLENFAMLEISHILLVIALYYVLKCAFQENAKYDHIQSVKQLP